MCDISCNVVEWLNLGAHAVMIVFVVLIARMGRSAQCTLKKMSKTLNGLGSDDG